MAGKSLLSDEQWRAVYERARAGEPFISLDQELGFSNGTVRKMLTRRYGWEPYKRAKPLTWEQTDAIHQRLQAGESLSAIARELGIRNSTNLYKMMARRYGYEADGVRYRAVWAPTIRLDHATDTDLAYLAGIMDGEGSIMHLSRGRSNPIWVVKVRMSDRPVIEWLHTFGGSFQVTHPKNPKHRTMYEWSMARQLDVQGMLNAIVPYMQVKKELAEDALADLNSGVVRRCDWTPEEVASGELERSGQYPRDLRPVNGFERAVGVLVRAIGEMEAINHAETRADGAIFGVAISIADRLLEVLNEVDPGGEMRLKVEPKRRSQ